MINEKLMNFFDETKTYIAIVLAVSSIFWIYYFGYSHFMIFYFPLLLILAIFFVGFKIAPVLLQTSLNKYTDLVAEDYASLIEQVNNPNPDYSDEEELGDYGLYPKMDKD